MSFLNSSSRTSSSNVTTVIAKSIETTDLLSKTGDSMTGDLTFTTGTKIIFGFDGSEQETAFSQAYIDKIDLSESKLEDVITDASGFNVNSNLNIQGNVSVSGSISIPDASLNKVKISGLVSDLSSIQSQIDTINNSLNENNSNDVALELRVDALETDNEANKTAISNIQGVNTSQTTSINGINTSIISHSNRLNTLESDNTNNKSRLDTLEDYKTSNDGVISAINQDIVVINGDITNIESSLLTKASLTQANNLSNSLDSLTTRVSAVESQNAADSVSIVNNSASIQQLNNSLSNITTSNTANTNAIQTINSTLTTHAGQISTLQSQNANVSNLSASVAALNASMDNKQDVLSVGNRLNCLYLGYGDVNNDKISTLSDIITNKSIQTQINEVKNSVSILTGFQNTDMLVDIPFLKSDNTSNKNRLTSLENVNITQATTNTSLQNQINTNKSTYDAYVSSNNTTIDDIRSGMTGMHLDIVDLETSYNDYVISNDSAISNIHSGMTGLNQSITTLFNSDVGINDLIETNESNFNAYVSSNNSIISGINSNLSTLNTFKTSQESTNSSVSTNLGTLNSFKTSQEANNTTVNDSLTSINSSITSLGNTKQNLLSGTSKLNGSYIDFTTIDLQYFDINSSLQSRLNNITSNITSNGNSISTIQSNISNLQAADIIHDGQITALENGLDLKQDVIDSSHKLSSNLVDVSGSILTSVISDINTNISELETDIGTKQNIINGSSKLPISYIDLSGNPLSYVDISSGLQSQLTNINSAISTLQGLQQGDITSFQTIQDNFDTIQESLLNKQDAISSSARLNANLISNGLVNNTKFDYLQNLTGDIQQQIDSLTTSAISSISLSGSDTTISNNTIVTNLKFSGDGPIVQTTAFTNDLKTEIQTASSNITSIQSDLTTAQGDITQLQTDLSGKQSVINGSSKLPISYVDLSGNALNYVDISSSLNTQLTNLGNSISALQTSDTSQSNSITSLTNSVNGLETNKQNVISGSNKISSEYVSYNLSDVSTELGSINSSISTLNTFKTSQESTNSSVSSSISTLNTFKTSQESTNTSVSNSLALKANIDNPTFTTKITTPSIKLSSGTNGHILTSDGTGLLTLQAPSSGTINYVNGTIVGPYIYASGNTTDSGVWKNFASITLNPGTYMVQYKLGWYISTVSNWSPTYFWCSFGTVQNAYNSGHQVDFHFRPTNTYTSNMSGIFYPHGMLFLNVGSTTTYYLTGYLNYSGSANVQLNLNQAYSYLNAVKLA